MKPFVSGIIGSVCSLIAMLFVFGIFKVPLDMANVYIAVGIAGFFSAFFAVLFSGKCCPLNKSTAQNAE